MKTKKILCTLMAVMCMGTAALTGCGSDSDSSSANSANSAAAAQTNESVDVTAVADKLKDGIKFKDELAELDEAKIEKIIGISADSLRHTGMRKTHIPHRKMDKTSVPSFLL